MVLDLSHISLFNLTYNKYLLSLIEVLDLASAWLEVIVIRVQLQEVLCLFADNHFVGWSCQTDTASLLNSLT